jgi:hypothetical protein
MFTSKFFGINTYAALISADSKQFRGKLNSSESTLTRNRGRGTVRYAQTGRIP